MRLPPGLVADLELMREHTGQTFASYIRRAILRALDEDKKEWKH
jgi:predicted DNA-binding protein